MGGNIFQNTLEEILKLAVNEKQNFKSFKDFLNLRILSVEILNKHS